MAEVAGLTLGVFGLAGLIGAFKDTIDLFRLIADTRHLGHQYEILDMKLDIEKTLLLHWAHRVRLLDGDYDKRLDDANTQELVIRILASIRSILTNTKNLQQRYGLRLESDPPAPPIPSDSITASPRSDPFLKSLPSELLTVDLPSELATLDQFSNPPPSRRRISQLRMDSFVQQFEVLQSRIDTRQKTTSMAQKARWVIRDKQKFEDLLRDLTDLTSKLNEVVPPKDDDFNSAHSMIRDDLAAIKKDIKRLKIVLEASFDRHQAIAESTQHVLDKTRQDRILQVLWFRKIEDRAESITQNHKKTLRWALKPPDDAASWDDLPAWLRHGTGIYWISGKAGSGKSTLTKYLRFHQSTKSLLSEWANGGHLLICHFFFSNLGSDEQKTQEGLSRTLLYQILARNPSLMQEALPNMWKEILESECRESRGDIGAPQSIELPSAAETRRAFEVITGSTAKIGRLCFFIDGLDEFVGDYEDGIAFIQRLAENEHIKVIVSSRPIPACVAAFRTLPRLELQDLTREDIRAYVEEKIGNHPSMRSHKRRFPEESTSLLRELVQKSSGVWLWIILACRSIRSGFDDHDRLSEIRRRVDDLPPELEDMFMHMLGKVRKRHQQQGAQLMKICYTYQKTKSPFVQKGLFALGLALVDDYHMNSIEIQHLTTEDKVEICEELEGRLRSRCWGLLELTAEKHTRSTRGSACQDINAKVIFMHRTVFEFLSNEDVWRLDCLQIQDELFHAPTALSLYGVHMATQLLYTKREIQAMDLFEEGIWWGAEADRQRPGDPKNCLFHLQPFLGLLPESELSAAALQRLSSATTLEASHGCSCVSLLLAVEAGAQNFVKQHADFQAMLKNDHGSCGDKPILYHALRKQFLSVNFNDQPSQGRFWSAEMVQLLLSSGCSVTESVYTSMGDTSLWVLWLEDVRKFGFCPLGERENRMLWSITEQFLSASSDAKLKDFDLEWLESLGTEHSQ
ncbi:prion-inhibition and propagation-domain-containing protein [Dactylonectria macrodidyma]|uniref:Prion-inhibition and propagation-domain-containing protein n=1 Tax=Dactylonectria macrodidyma TaxID=307937 RepID=A0A9P9FUI9_9HYPO|nr:prion-inhibition and propagation-domain-containing protein [Dactylonectria macrodidyma]